MDNKLIAVAGAVIGLIAVGGVYHWLKSNDNENPKHSTSNKETTMNAKDTSLDQLLLSTAKSLYNDVIATTEPGGERNEQVRQLMVTLIYSHVNSRDCTDDVNRTYVDWLRKMALPNPAHYETIIRRCADEGIVTMSGVRTIIDTQQSGMTIVTKEHHRHTVKSLAAIKCVDDAIAAGVYLPEDVYVLTAESILDIPVKVILTGAKNVVVLEDFG